MPAVRPGSCTSGFVVHKYTSNTCLVLTAGHCIEAHGGYDKVWEHNNNSFGRSLRETWMPGGTGPADVGLITIVASDVALMTNKNQIRRTNGIRTRPKAARTSSAPTKMAAV